MDRTLDEHSQPLDQVFTAGEFGDDVIRISSELKQTQLDIEELKEIGKKKEIKMGETEEEMMLKREDPKTRIE